MKGFLNCFVSNILCILYLTVKINEPCVFFKIWNEMKKIFRSEIAFLTRANDEWKFLFSSRPLSFVIVDQSVCHVIYFIITIQLMVPLFSMLLFPFIVFAVLLKVITLIYCWGNIPPYWKYGTWWRILYSTWWMTSADVGYPV